MNILVCTINQYRKKWGNSTSGVIDTEKINPHDLCYQWSKHDPYFLFGELRIKDFNDEPHSAKNNINSKSNPN